MNTYIPRILTAVFLVFGVVLTVSSGFDLSIVGLLSGQGGMIRTESLPPALQLEQGFLHGAAPDQQTATQQLILGLLLILLGFGIYTFWFIRNRDFPPTFKTHQKNDACTGIVPMVLDRLAAWTAAIVSTFTCWCIGAWRSTRTIVAIKKHNDRGKRNKTTLRL